MSRKRLGDATLRLEDMDRCGIEGIVTDAAGHSGHTGSRDSGRHTAKRMNDDLAEQVLAAHPEPICRLAAVALQDVRAAGRQRAFLIRTG
jgi:hypothetical protein